MKIRLIKVKQEHTILEEFTGFLALIEKDSAIQRIIPGRIARKQKGSSLLKCSVSYLTSTGIKLKISKGSTAQELFIITKKDQEIVVVERIMQIWEKYLGS